MNKREDSEGMIIGVEDSRVECKYGADCFQKNPEHHRKYKHPISNKENDEKESNSSMKRKSPDNEGSSSSELSRNKKQNVSSNLEGSLNAAKAENECAKDTEDTYSDARQLILEIFLVSMPNDFYRFYNFCRELKPNEPSTAFKIVDIKLVGPYDVLNGLITKSTPKQSSLLTHWRYYYDPPEFQTILKGNDKEGLHFGYWRDRPSGEPVFVASNSCNVNCKIKPVAENIFGAIALYMEERIKKANPFEKTSYFNLLGKIKAYATKHNISLQAKTPKMSSREKNVVARTIHGAGIVCPYNKKSQLGYRELSVSDSQLLKIVKKIDDAKSDEDRLEPRTELGEVVRLATIAGDECDFGTCLELGHDLLSTGCTYVQNAALLVLSIAYNQLERQAFLKIVEEHMKNRKKGCNTAALPDILPKKSTVL
ncbi:PREDICTED: UPF0609 protein C4orf27 homolog [Ceratosolen solmsi marchali]|uniref:UPF0609 protein C4orf27 homolog n=1 Tax=Ceratosolen solmsi marchali TaxID=326594 RepID=A0AAJ7DZE3_9HYME|nr:PREDICTED: UPF0609 protein C4orf27 homolog [Ceratosolen solmsi marchali]